MKSAWSGADLTAGVEAAVTRTGVVGDPQAVAELVEDVRARAVGRCRSVLDPEEWTPTVMSRHLTSDAVVAADLRLNLGLAGLAGGGGPGRRRRGGGGGGRARRRPGRGGRSGVRDPTSGGGDRPGRDGQDPDAGGGQTTIRRPGPPTWWWWPRPAKRRWWPATRSGWRGRRCRSWSMSTGFAGTRLGRWWRLEVGQEDPVTGRVYLGTAGGVGAVGGVGDRGG